MTFTVHSVETAPAGSRAALEEIESKYGFIPNLAAVFAESPAALNGLLGALTSFDVAEMSLPPLERQVVLLAASVQNRCAYCTAAHSMLASVQGMDRAEVVRLQQGLPLSDARLEALRNFVEGIVQHRGRLRESDVQRFLAAGFTRAQVLEIIFGVALKTLTNYANHVAMPPVNEQFAEYLPDWPDVA